MLSRIRAAVRRLSRRLAHRLLWRRLFNIPESVDGCIETIDGLLLIRRLQKKQSRASTPCGFAYRTEYYLDGRLVRRDVTQDVIRGLAIASAASIDPAKEN